MMLHYIEATKNYYQLKIFLQIKLFVITLVIF